MAEDETKLKRQHAVLKSKLTSAKTYITGVIAQKVDGKLVDKDIYYEVEARYDRLVSLLEQFQEIQGKLEDILPLENLSLEDSEWLAFENSYYSVVASYKGVLVDLNPQPVINNQADGSCSERGSVSVRNKVAEVSVTRPQLPAIPIPKFDGTSECWLEFRDTFISLIHSNESISDMEKLYFLKGALEGEAKEVIHLIDMTASNYSMIWDMLYERYNNTVVLVNDHLKSLVNMTPLVKESHSDLRHILDNITKHIHALGKLGVPTDNWDPLIIFLVCSKLDPATQRVWEEKRPRDKLSSLSEFKSFLRGRIDMLISLEKSKGV